MGKPKREKQECSTDELDGLLQQSVDAGLYKSVEEAADFVLSDSKPKTAELDDFDRTVACQSLQQQLADIQFNALLKMEGIAYLPMMKDDTANIDAVMLVNGPKKRGALIGPAGRRADFTIRRYTRRWIIFPGPKSKQVQESEIKRLAQLLRTSVTRVKNAAEFAARSCFPTANSPWIPFGSTSMDKLNQKITSKLRNTAYANLITAQPSDDG